MAFSLLPEVIQACRFPGRKFWTICEIDLERNAVGQEMLLLLPCRPLRVPVEHSSLEYWQKTLSEAGQPHHCGHRLLPVALLRASLPGHQQARRNALPGLITAGTAPVARPHAAPLLEASCDSWRAS